MAQPVQRLQCLLLCAWQQQSSVLSRAVAASCQRQHELRHGTIQITQRRDLSHLKPVPMGLTSSSPFPVGKGDDGVSNGCKQLPG